MNPERDPRIDPRPGDVLEVEVHRVIVTYVNHEYVMFVLDGYISGSDLTHEYWRGWTADARIIEAAKEELA